MCAGGAAAEGAGLQRISAAAYQYWAKLKPPAEGSVVVMLADGYGPQIHTIARGLLREQSGNASALLDLDAHLVGSAITASASNAITDSAAGATAYAAATKSYNGAVGVLHRKGEDPTACEHSAGRCAVRPVASLFEACRARGMATGLVVTTVLPHATPASFSAHAAYRYSYELIAQQQLEADPPIDVLLGGGRRFFDARRRDGRDLLAEHAARYHLVESRATLLAARGAAAPPARALLGLFADGDMHYEIDRERRAAGGAGGGGSGGGSVGGEREQPSLEEMTEVALERLEAVAGARGFCLLVEGSCPDPRRAPEGAGSRAERRAGGRRSRIDHALHSNDAAAAARDALAYDRAFAKAAARVAGARRGAAPLLVVSVADHSTGGIAALSLSPIPIRPPPLTAALRGRRHHRRVPGQLLRAVRPDGVLQGRAVRRARGRVGVRRGRRLVGARAAERV